MKHIKNFRQLNEAVKKEAEPTTLKGWLTFALDYYAMPGEHWNNGKAEELEERLKKEFPADAKAIAEIFEEIGQRSNDTEDFYDADDEPDDDGNSEKGELEDELEKSYVKIAEMIANVKSK